MAAAVTAVSISGSMLAAATPAPESTGGEPLDLDAAIPGNCSAMLQAEAVQPAGQPVLITVTWTNTGKRAIEYTRSVNGEYPVAESFPVQAVDAFGNAAEVRMANGEMMMGSFTMLGLDPGKTVIMPAALEPLPAGNYTLQFGSGKGVPVNIKADADLVRKREQDLLVGILRDDNFVGYVATKYPDSALTSGLVQALGSGNSTAVFRAAWVLSTMPHLGNGAGGYVSRAIKTNLAVKDTGYNPMQDMMLVNLTAVAANVGSDEALDAVLAVAHSDGSTAVRRGAVQNLGKFTQARAAEELRGLLNDADIQIQFAAVVALSDLKDFSGFETLVNIAQDKDGPPLDDRWRVRAYEDLVRYFPDDPRTKAALHPGQSDASASVSRAANQALFNLVERQVRKENASVAN